MTILDEIANYAKERVSAAQQSVSADEMKKRAMAMNAATKIAN